MLSKVSCSGSGGGGGGGGGSSFSYPRRLRPAFSKPAVPDTFTAPYVCHKHGVVGSRVRPVIKSHPVSYKLDVNESEPQFPHM